MSSCASPPAFTGAMVHDRAQFTMYGLTYRLFKAPAGQQYSGSEGPTLPFHPRWRKLADEVRCLSTISPAGIVMDDAQIASSISPAIALHWRQEAVQNANFIPDFVQCARDAHAKLDSLRQGLKTVYFMTVRLHFSLAECGEDGKRSHRISLSTTSVIPKPVRSLAPL